jgi:branched-chain amino acid transport system ATP-binding protein
MLEIKNLCSGYGRIPILNKISFEIMEGEAVGVLGHNGMGKTTLLKTIVGEIKSTDGEIKFNGHDITNMETYKRSRLNLGYVPQGREIFPQLSVLENLKIGEVVTSDQSMIPDILEHFPVLKKLLDQPGSSLSGGQQQILALARCLVTRPKLILLDEPTEGIQPSIIDEIAEKLTELKQQFNLTILLVEQNLEFIQKIVDNVLIIQNGKILTKLKSSQLKDPATVNKYLGL